MRHFLRFGWAAAVGLTVAGAAVGQQGSDNGSSSTGNGAQVGTTNQGGTILSAPPQITGLDTTSGATVSSSLNQSNALGAYYANPYYQGRAGAGVGEAPGGFGTPLFGTTTGGSAGGRGGTSTGFGSTSTGTRGRTGTSSSNAFGSTTGFGSNTGGTTSGFGTSTGTGFGSTTGTGLRGGQQGLNFSGQQGFSGTGTNSAGQVIALPRPIAYTASIRFAAPPMTAPRMQTEVRAVLDRSISLSNPRGIEVVADGAVVVLRGTVKSEDEARLAEGMIRLTPGVRDVKNELKFPAP